MSQKDSVEEYLVRELLKNNSNVELVKDFLKKLNKEEVIELFASYLAKEKFDLKEIRIPVSIFKAKKLSSFELIVNFLKEDVKLKNNNIAKLLMRSQQSVWNTYKNSKKKFSGKLDIKASEYDIPVSVFQNKDYTVLESIIVFMKEKHDLRFSEIAKLINRDQRTIWTVYNRKKKR